MGSHAQGLDASVCMQVSRVTVRVLQVDALIVMMVVVNHFVVDHHVCKSLRLLGHDNRRNP